MSDKSTARKDVEMVRILEEMLSANENISARAIARKHSSIRHASSIVRNPERRALISEYKERQSNYHTWLDRQSKQSRSAVATDIARKDMRITELEAQVEVLRASLVAVIRVVGEQGGMNRWLEFFGNYESVRDTLRKLGVLDSATVTGSPAMNALSMPSRTGNHSSPEQVMRLHVDLGETHEDAPD